MLASNPSDLYDLWPAGNLNLQAPSTVARFNYLHYGDALQHLANVDFSTCIGKASRRSLIRSLGGNGRARYYISEVIRGYGNPRERSIDMTTFCSEIRQSQSMRIEFSRLHCRGFSYAFRSGIRLITPLRPSIDLRFAIVPSRGLFYPSRIRKYLRQKRSPHFNYEYLPPIAFALGTETEFGWFIFVIQSDLSSRTPAYIREHFRGWRRILFASILRLSLRRAVSLYLPLASDVLATCRTFLGPRALPETWKAIYDETAEQFGMSLTTLPRDVDIQTLSHGVPHHVQRAYRLLLTQDTVDRYRDIFNCSVPSIRDVR